MKSLLVTAAAAAVGMASVADAIRLQKRDNPAVVAASIGRTASTVPPHVRDRRRRLARRDTLAVDLDNDVTLYFANVTIGTPPQSLRMHIDTGSSDLWVNTPASQLCESRAGEECAEAGTYTANSSSTYSYINSAFNISYVDGSGAVGDYVSDTLTIGDASLDALQFGIGYSSSSQEGVLGIGYPGNEVQVNNAGLDAYPNLPVALQQAGLASAQAYSLWLNDLDANTGTILFGGVDTAKYTGNLRTLPILPVQTFFVELVIALTGVSVSGSSASLLSPAPIPVLLDSGSSLTYLPMRTVRSLYNRYGVQYDSSQDMAVVSCGVASQDETVDFDFSGVKISVPLNELVISVVPSQSASAAGDSQLCIFGISPIQGDTFVLGDTFLRSAYVVYDLENNGISLAQTNFNATGSNVMEITSDGVPNAEAVTTAATAVAAGQTGGDSYFGGSNSGFSDPNGDDGESAASSLSPPSSTASLLAAAAAAVALGVVWQGVLRVA